MNQWRLIGKSLWYYSRTNLAVALGVAAATAVVTGALLVGDSVRGSLRHLTLDRLGKIEDVLATDRFFRAALADEVGRSATSGEAITEPAILLPATTLETRTSAGVLRASQVVTIGCRATFWQLDTHGDGTAHPHPAAGEIFINRPLADELGIDVGAQLTLRLADASQIPADSTLGQKTNRVRSLPLLKVARILEPEGLGRFGLQPNQTLPRNAYLALESLQDVLEVGERVNAILVGSPDAATDDETLAARHAQRNAALRPTLQDLGIRVERVRRVFPDSSDVSENPDVVFDYFNVSTDRMLFEDSVADAIAAATARWNGQPALAYLADSLRRADAPSPPDVEIPYSIVTGIERSDSFPVTSAETPLAADEMVLNQWAADRLSVKSGDEVVVEYFEPETAHGEHRLARHTFRVHSIVPLVEPARPYDRRRPALYEQRPGIFNDPDLTPVVEGITDQDSIEDWEAPFPFDIRRMLPIDDDYWKNHRTTPKAFVALATAQKLWGSRFGHVTSFRIPFRDGLTEAAIETALLEQLSRPEVLAPLGFEFRAVKSEGLAASRGTTPFDGLFLGLSFFLILAAVLLVALLFRLGVEQRLRQLGILSAVGLTRAAAARTLVWEGLVIAAGGGILGVLIGVGYSALMLAGLRSEHWWRGAIGTPFLELYITPLSLVIGYVSGLVVCAVAIVLSSRQIKRVATRRLLAGHALESSSQPGKRAFSRLWQVVIALTLLAAVALAVAATQLAGEAQAGAFVGGGFLVLVALVLWQWLRNRAAPSMRRMDLVRLAASSARRNPTRSLLTIGLMGAATFLIVAMSSFRVTPSLVGAGGFRLMASSSAPIFDNLNDAQVRSSMFGAQAAETLAGTQIYSLRWKAGDDASCRNLYKVSRPRVLGVPDDFVERYASEQAVAFRWGGVAANDKGQRPANPWTLLQAPATGGAIPVILDQNTAMYSLHWTGGIGSEYTVAYDEGVNLKFKIVGLLANTLLQGSLLISEDHFRQTFPDVSGYRYFLIDAPEEKLSAVRETLEDRLGDQGLDVQPTATALADLLAVQNTYLSTFQSLGALGLLLGTFGLATVQARSVLERRGELALLRAEGFARRRVSQLVLLENASLLLQGLATGVVAAICAVLPHILLGGAQVPVWGVLQLLVVILLIGLATGALAVRLLVRGSLIQALRGE